MDKLVVADIDARVAGTRPRRVEEDDISQFQLVAQHRSPLRPHRIRRLRQRHAHGAHDVADEAGAFTGGGGVAGAGARDGRGREAGAGMTSGWPRRRASGSVRRFASTIVWTEIWYRRAMDQRVSPATTTCLRRAPGAAGVNGVTPASPGGTGSRCPSC